MDATAVGMKTVVDVGAELSVSVKEHQHVEQEQQQSLAEVALRLSEG